MHPSTRLTACLLSVSATVSLAVCLPVSLFVRLCMLSPSLSTMCVCDFCWNSKDLQILVHSFGCCAALKQLRCCCLEVQPPEVSFTLAEPIKIYGQVIFKADTCRQHKNVTSSAQLGLRFSLALSQLASPCPSLPCLTSSCYPFDSFLFCFTAPQRLVSQNLRCKCLFCCFLSHCICLCVFHIARFLFISLTRQKAQSRTP